MKVFISSVIRGFETYREAAAQGARALRHQVLRAEDFGATADSPQRVCLAAVREADIAFEGPGTYTATLHLDKTRLNRPENIREVDLMLADIAEWLQTNPPPGARQIL